MNSIFLTAIYRVRKLEKKVWRVSRNKKEPSVANESSSTINVDLADSSDLDFPDGGIRAWCAVMGLFLGLTNCYGLINSTSAIETYIAHNQLAGASASTVGWIFLIYVCVSLMFGVLTGGIFDSHGPRIPIFLGGLLTWAGIFATANCQSTYQFILAFGILTGLGTAVQLSLLIGIISHYFNKRRGFAFGVATIGASFGGAIFPIMLRRLYSEVGFAWTMRIFAFLLAFLDLAALILIQPRFPPKKTPGDNKKEQILTFLKKTIDIKAFKEPVFLLLTLAVTFSESFLVSAMTYYGLYALFTGASENTAYILLTVCNAMGLFARVVAGYLADRYGRFNVAAVLIFMAALCCLVIWLPFGHKIGGLYAHAVIFGITSASVLSLTPICLSQVCRVEDFGKRFATCYFVVAIGTLVSIPLAGLFIGSKPTSTDYNNFIIFLSILGLMGLFCWIAGRWCAVKWRWCAF